jgi:LPXTG-motif cell wall-anchored protein
MPANGEHSDEASVNGAGQYSGTPVDDEDEWHGHVPPKPEVDIEKWNTEDGQIVGDFDNAPGKPLDAGSPTPISMTITNTGNEPLVDVMVSDATLDGPALRGLSCDFSPLGGPASGVRWAGPFAVGDSFVCTATLPAMNGGQTHSDEASVDGAGQFSGKSVDDKDPWHGHVPPKPDIDIEKWSTGDGPDNGDFDDAPGLEIEPGQPTPITMTITNTGNEPLVKVKVSDRTNEGLALEGLSCDFSALGGPATGTSWKGPFQPGDSFDCTATLPAMDLEEIHSDTAQVEGAGQYTGEPVDDKDDWHGHTPGGEVLPGGAGTLPNTGGPMFGLTILGSLLSVLGALVLLRRRQQA